MKNCIFLNSAGINNLEWKWGKCQLPQNPSKTRTPIFISSWFKIHFWSVNQKIPHSDSTAVIISPLRADWPGDVEAFWCVRRWCESASHSLRFRFQKNIFWRLSVHRPSPAWETFLLKINLLISFFPSFFPVPYKAGLSYRELCGAEDLGRIASAVDVPFKVISTCFKSSDSGLSL